jgi:hypothetical protein
MTSATGLAATAHIIATAATTTYGTFFTDGVLHHFQWNRNRISLDFGERSDHWKQLIVYISPDSDRHGNIVLFTSNPANSLPADSWVEKKHRFQLNTMIVNEDTRSLIETRDLPKFHGYTLVAALSTAHSMTQHMHDYLTREDFRAQLESEMEKAVAHQKEVDDCARMTKQGMERGKGRKDLGKMDDSTEKTLTSTAPSKADATSSISSNGSAPESFGTNQASELSVAIHVNSASGHQA